MSNSYDIDRDLQEASAMVNGLEHYVHQDALYGSVGGMGFFAASNMPSLTTGALLMRIRRLQVLDDAGELSDKQRDRLQKIVAAHGKVYRENRTHYEAKLLREAKSRLKAMSQFFEECHASPRACAQNYRPEALRRTIAQEAIIALDESGVEMDAELKQVKNQMDSRLRQYAAEPTDFLLDEALKEAYPQETFWWLYHRPRTPER